VLCTPLNTEDVDMLVLGYLSPSLFLLFLGEIGIVKAVVSH
jgi:hypothetical protein